MRQIMIDPTRMDSSPQWAAESRLVMEYLEACPDVLTGFAVAVDVIDPSRPPRVPTGAVCDGLFVWSSALPYYVREHDVVPPDDLLAHIRAQNYRAPSVTLDQLDQALNFLRETAEE